MLLRPFKRYSATTLDACICQHYDSRRDIDHQQEFRSQYSLFYFGLVPFDDDRKFMLKFPSVNSRLELISPDCPSKTVLHIWSLDWLRSYNSKGLIYTFLGWSLSLSLYVGRNYFTWKTLNPRPITSRQTKPGLSTCLRVMLMHRDYQTHLLLM
jgi:hypothetical protein